MHNFKHNVCTLGNICQENLKQETSKNKWLIYSTNIGCKLKTPNICFKLLYLVRHTDNKVASVALSHQIASTLQPHSSDMFLPALINLTAVQLGHRPRSLTWLVWLAVNLEGTCWWRAEHYHRLKTWLNRVFCGSGGILSSLRCIKRNVLFRGHP